jgi:3-deoxy-D-manno-octulosonic-acid transferase
MLAVPKCFPTDGSAMTWLFDCLYALAGLWLLPVWLWKLPRARRYRAGIVQRLGRAPVLPSRPRLWVHCASVGEAAVPRSLLDEFLAGRPDWDVVFSTNTDTGAGRLRDLYPGATVFYFPLDFSSCVDEALRRVRPSAVLLIELEVWPNFNEACCRRAIPIVIINGRIGAGSRRLLRVVSRLARRLWDPVRLCCARSSDDADGFAAAGLPRARIAECGLLKCDRLALEPDAARLAELRDLFAIADGAPVVVAGSTHQGEEGVLVAACRDLKRRHPELRLILVPRHIERAGSAAEAVSGRGLPVLRKTALDAGDARARGDEVIVVDTIGELVACYGLGTLAFVGRSLLPPGGGQNVLEPAALGVPVVTGPYIANFVPETRMLVAAGAAVVVGDQAQLVRELDAIAGDPERARRMGAAGHEAITHNRGATRRTLAGLDAVLSGAASPLSWVDGLRRDC